VTEQPIIREQLPRVGHIEFLNCLPLSWGLEQVRASEVMGLVSDTPDVLSDALVAGTLDVGPISLVEALKHAGEVMVLPEVAVGCDGPVRSVCLVSKVPVAELSGATISLGSTSRTSVVLARLLLEQHFGLAPTYRTDPPDLAAMLEVADAAVLIGDPALRATLVEAPARHLHLLDLGAAWKDWTGLPMVFAVWAARRDFVERSPRGLEAVRIRFAQALREARSRPAEVVAAAAGISGFSQAQLEDYFDVLHFGLGERQRQGIARFTAVAHPLIGTAQAVPIEYLPPMR